MYPNWSFGDRLRKARTTVQMTQGEFAEAIGIKEGTLAAWETDRAAPRSRDIVDVAKRIEALTNISTAWLLGIELPPPPNPPASFPVPRERGRVRHLRTVTRVEEPQKTEEVSDEALAYLQLAETLPCLDLNQEPFGWQPDRALSQVA